MHSESSSKHTQICARIGRRQIQIEAINKYRNFYLVGTMASTVITLYGLYADLPSVTGAGGAITYASFGAIAYMVVRCSIIRRKIDKDLYLLNEIEIQRLLELIETNKEIIR